MRSKSVFRCIKLFLLLLGVGGIWWKVYWQRGLDVTWQADVEATVAGISEVPKLWADRHSLDDYRNQVRKVCSNLKITLHSNGKATLQGGLFPSNDAWWRRDNKFDYWVQSGTSWFTPTIGHGFTYSWFGETRIKYSMEWNEDRQVVREFIVLKRL